VWDALDAAATTLEHDAGRRAIIVITDGRSTGNRLGFGEVSARLEQAGIPIVVVALDLQRSPQPDPYARLRRLADNTGGACILVKRDDLESGISRAVAALRTQ
jgi:Mg-chelatase subunit ChlD